MRKAGPARDIPPPLELLCLKALWSLQEANVRDVQRALEARQLAYTTVMTLLERLVRKGAVARKKEGRAFLYFPQVSRDSLRRIALREFLDVYFDGSAEALVEFVGSRPEPQVREQTKAETQMDAVLL